VTTVATKAPAQDDPAIVARARAGDFAAFETLVERHERRIYAIALRILRRTEDAEDAIQTALLEALEHVADFRGDAPFGAWLGRIAAHAALKVLRRRVGPGGVAIVAGGTGAGPCGGTPGDDCDPVPRPEFIATWRDDPIAEVERRELAALLDAALEALPEGQRVVFVLRDLSGLSTEETAAALSITPSSVKVRLMRARLALRERLTRAFGDPARRVEPHAHDEGGGHGHGNGHGHGHGHGDGVGPTRIEGGRP